MRLCFLAVTLALVGSPVIAQEVGVWTSLPNSPTSGYRFEDIDFVDPRTGWVIRGDGKIWETTDAGADWTLLDDIGLFARSAVMTTPTHGFVGTLDHPNVLFEVTPSGAVDISDRIEGPMPLGICGLWAVSEEVIYGAGWFASPAHIIKTTDGGATWISQDMSTYTGSLIDVYFWDEQRGVAVGGTDGTNQTSRAVVLMTEDGGDTWSVRHVSSEDGEWAWKISFPTPTTGYVSVEGTAFSAKVLKTTDAGLTWTELTIPNSNDLQGLGFLTADVGWASGRGTTSVTIDGGASWDPVTAELDGAVNRFQFFGDSLGYAVGGQVYRYSAVPPTNVSDLISSVPFALESGYPNPFTERTTLRYLVAEAAEVDISVFDLSGRRVATLVRGARTSGDYVAVWDGRNSEGRKVAAGIYFVRLAAGDHQATRRVLRLD